MRLRALCVGLGLAVLLPAAALRAHAPLARAVAVAPDGSGAVAVRMPGFGFLLRAASDARFAYACDALIGVSPLAELTPIAYRADGTLLIGTDDGLRVLERDGCPRAERLLPELAVLALAVHGSGRLYAVTQAGDAAPVVQRSDDEGAQWRALAALDALPVTGLVLDASDPERLFISQSTATGGAVLTTTQDGGATLQRSEHVEPLVVLHAQLSPPRLWARARIGDQPVGVRIAHAANLDSAWHTALEVNFFGGFAVDASDPDVIFVGDEARGVFRSEDGGESFRETQPELSSAGLSYGDGALWSCTPGLPSDTALARSSDAREAFEPVLAFDQVEQLVRCEAALDVERVCAAAWAEWQRDVLGVFEPWSDAGAPAADDAGLTPDAGATPPSAADAAFEPKVGPSAEAGGCAVVTPRRAHGSTFFLAGLALGALRTVRRRRAA